MRIRHIASSEAERETFLKVCICTFFFYFAGEGGARFRIQVPGNPWYIGYDCIIARCISLWPPDLMW